MGVFAALTGQEELCCEGLAGCAAGQPFAPVAALVCCSYLGEVQRPVAVHHVSETHQPVYQTKSSLHFILIITISLLPL